MTGNKEIDSMKMGRRSGIEGTGEGGWEGKGELTVINT